jgi:DNA repair protein RadD
MQLRPRQTQFVDRCTEALLFHGNTLGVAPTGAGKTVCLSAIASDVNGWDGPVCVVQHRDELLAQNRKTLHAFNPKAESDLFNADRKRWKESGVTFAMAQTLARADNLKTMPPLGLLVLDEAHHAPSDSYLRTIDHTLKTNPKCKLLGVTATPNRGDKKAMRAVFSNCADQISIKELIETGFLVRPRTFVIDIGTQDALRNVRRTAEDFDMTEVERIMDHQVLNDRVVEEWKEVAADRLTVVFCSTVAHAEHVADTFKANDVSAAVVHGELPTKERADILAAFDQGTIRVIVNVAVLVEGWDCQPASCIVLLRPSSYKSTMIQMVGRGLRKIDPERYPGIRKDDCIVLDFGTSILQHGSIEQEVMLDGQGVKTCNNCEAIVPKQCQECPICGMAFPVEPISLDAKTCKECGAPNPIGVRFCVSCGAEFPKKEKAELEEFKLSEIDVLQMSPYRWESIFEGLAWVACALEAWGIVVNYDGRWIALGGKKETPLRLLGDYADQALALVSADDFLRECGDMETAAKTARWLSLPPTDAQLKRLGLSAMTAMGMTRYRASCCLTWMFNERGVKRRLEDYQNQRQLAA